jgi:hypothetical protein
MIWEKPQMPRHRHITGLEAARLADGWLREKVREVRALTRTLRDQP